MNKKILFTGGTGFLGRNLIPLLSEKNEVIAPSRKELDLKNVEVLEKYLKNNHFDIIIHAAIPNIAFKKDSKETLLKDSLVTFMKFYQMQDYFGKLIYFGSGAEFDKSKEIVKVVEENFGKSLPYDDYGLAKYIMNILCLKSKNIYNLRIFGCYGPTDATFKLITYVIQCCIKDEPIILRQNCVFDYMLVSDLYPVLECIMNDTPKFHDYNICSGTGVTLKDICYMVQKEMGTSLPIYIKEEGLNHEYTAQNSRICKEFPNLKFTPLLEGIKKQIQYEKEAYKNEKKSS